MDDYPGCVEIVPLAPCHVERISEIERECFPNPWSYDAYLAELSNPLAVVFVAVVDGETAGYADAHHIVDELYINNIAVAEPYRQNGLATRLLKQFYKYAKKNDVVSITLEVRESNRVAIEFYERQGFEPVGRRHGFYINPTEDALLMTKTF